MSLILFLVLTQQQDSLPRESMCWEIFSKMALKLKKLKTVLKSLVHTVAVGYGIGTGNDNMEAIWSSDSKAWMPTQEQRHSTELLSGGSI